MCTAAPTRHAALRRTSFGQLGRSLLGRGLCRSAAVRPIPVPLGRSLCSAAARPIRPFLVERYPGWTAVDRGEAESLTSSEIEPLSLPDLLSYATCAERAEWEATSLGYAEQPGGWALREAIAEVHYERIRADQINVMAPQEGIFLAMHALLSPGDAVIYTAPAYQSLFEVARAVGCHVVPWHPRIGPSTAGAPCVTFAASDLRRLLDSLAAEGPVGRKLLVVMNLPHNPTGATLTAAEFEGGEEHGSGIGVVGVCRAHGAHLFVDEMYRGLEHGGVPAGAPGPQAAPPRRLRAACDAYELGVSLSGLSKTVGLPGLRIGWLATQDAALLDRVAQLKDYVSVCPPAPSEALGRIALRHNERLMERSRAILDENLGAVGGFLRRHAGLLSLASQPRGGTFCLVRVGDLGGGSASEYASALRGRAGLMLLPSGLFGLRDDSLRLGYGKRGLARLLERWSLDLVGHGLRV